MRWVEKTTICLFALISWNANKEKKTEDHGHKKKCGDVTIILHILILPKYPIY